MVETTYPYMCSIHFVVDLLQRTWDQNDLSFRQIVYYFPECVGLL